MITTNDLDTEEVIGIAKKAAEKRGTSHVVIATTQGECGRVAAKVFKDSGIRVIAVTHSTGFRNPGEQELPGEVREELEGEGISVITGTMPFHGIEDALRKMRGSYSTTVAMADALRLLGQGIKVGVEIACMTVDAGAVPEGEDIITVTGTHRGADTVALIRGSCTRRILELKVREVIAKPTDW